MLQAAPQGSAGDGGGHQLASPGKSPAWTLGFLRCLGQVCLPSHKGRSAQAWLWPFSGFISPT